MNNAIVYSIHSNNTKIDTLPQWRQTRYSIDTLRSFNKDIPIVIYMSPVGISNTITMPLNMHNVTIKEFNAKPEDALDNQMLSTLTSHKWVSTFDALELYDNVLYVDGDTVWYKDPNVLFNKYGSGDTIVSKEDQLKVFVDFAGIKNKVMNDGVNLLSSNMLKYKDYILEQRVLRVKEWQDKYRDVDDDDIKTLGIQWASCQYAVSEAMHDIGLPVIFFDRSDVLLGSEDLALHEPESSGAAVCHYLSHNSSKMLPEQYNLWIGSNTRHGKIKSITIRNGTTYAATNMGEFNVVDLYDS